MHCIYNGDGESRNSGSNLLSRIPQKGHKAFGRSCKSVDLIRDKRSNGDLDIVKKVRGASLETHLWQHMQNQRGVVGQTCMETAQRGSL